MVAVKSKAQVIVVRCELKKLTWAVSHVFSRVKECPKVRFSHLCKLLFLRLFFIVYCCVASDPGQQKAHPRCKNL